MPSTTDWAAKAAEKIDAAQRRLGDMLPMSELEVIIATHAEPLMALLQESHREHIFTLDSRRGTMRAAILGCNTKFFPDDPCTCGAADWNARVDAILSRTEP